MRSSGASGGFDGPPLCKIVMLLTDVRHREPVYHTLHPVSTRLVVTALARSEWLVEIDATEVIPD